MSKKRAHKPAVNARKTSRNRINMEKAVTGLAVNFQRLTATVIRANREMNEFQQIMVELFPWRIRWYLFKERVKQFWRRQFGNDKGTPESAGHSAGNEKGENKN